MAAGSEPQTQQSWAAWFLDGYATSVIAEHEESNDDSAYDSMSPTSSEYGNVDLKYQNSYAKTGRGGAGNFQWQSQQPADLEAQKPISLKEKRKAALKIEHIDTSAAVRHAQARNTTGYAGRGGAGNFRFVQSNSVQASPTSTSFPKSPISASTPVYVGRGGAGNFASARSTSESQKALGELQEQVEAEKRREQAEQQVQNILSPPSQAYLGPVKRSMLPAETEIPT